MARLFIARLGREPERHGRRGVHIPPTVRQVTMVQDRLRQHPAHHVAGLLRELDYVLQGSDWTDDCGMNGVARIVLDNCSVNR